jgi:hypothetical protein
MLPKKGLADASPRVAELIPSPNSTSPLDDEAGPQARGGTKHPQSTTGGLGNREAAELPLLATEGAALAAPLAPATPVVVVNALN